MGSDYFCLAELGRVGGIAFIVALPWTNKENYLIVILK